MISFEGMLGKVQGMCNVHFFRYHSRVQMDTHEELPRAHQQDPMQNQIQLYYSSFDTMADLELQKQGYVVTGPHLPLSSDYRCLRSHSQSLCNC